MAGDDPMALVASQLRVEAVFGVELPELPSFRAAVTSALDGLYGSGSRGTLEVLSKG